MTRMLIRKNEREGEVFAARPMGALSAAARHRLEAVDGGPALLNDWVRAVFVHYEVDPAALQPLVPYALELRGGRAYVSLVAFVMRRLRPCIGGRITEWLSAPVSNHGFLNVRTYVRHHGENGIFFLAEWMPNPVGLFLGPRTFGLPYRFGRLDYAHNHERGELRGRVCGTDKSKGVVGRPVQLRYRATIDTHAAFAPCDEGTLAEFLLERYTCFTERRGVYRLFRIWHEPWLQCPIDVTIEDDALLSLTGPWLQRARLIGANYSPGVLDVWMSRPHCINGRFCSRAWPDADVARNERNSP